VKTLTKLVGRISYPVVGYLFLLLGFAFLGLTVAALATRSELALASGGALAGSFAAAVMSFRAGAVKLAKARASGDDRHNEGIWSKPLRQEQVDQYVVNFRGEQELAAAVADADVAPAMLPVRASRPRWQSAAVPSRLSA
jgi:hypothetical protein